MARWTVKTSDGVLYEYDDAHGTVSGGALCLHMDDGGYQFWGPGFWEWAKHEKVVIDEWATGSPSATGTTADTGTPSKSPPQP